MGGEIGAFVEAFPRFLIWSASAGVLLIVASTIYVLLTPWKEFAEIKRGNSAAGLALGGAIAGLAIPIASTLASSVSLIDLVIWGVVALLLQLIVYRLVDLLLGGIPARIAQDESGAAIVLVAAKLSSALILAAGLWDPALQRF
ncbi:MAG: membrane protein [Hyphomonadaceae bacterium BRH_c29]|jgi:putative membrane protein|nr:MAG: membrane protein [Hyphomonadaceae bacterium BRH_c29]